MTALPQPRLCPSCRSLTGRSGTSCPTCGAFIPLENLIAGLRWRAAGAAPSGLRRLDRRTAVYLLVLLPGFVIAPVAGMILCRSSFARSSFTSEERSWIFLLGICNVLLSAMLLSRIGGAMLLPVFDAFDIHPFRGAAGHGRDVLKI